MQQNFGRKRTTSQKKNHLLYYGIVEKYIYFKKYTFKNYENVKSGLEFLSRNDVSCIITPGKNMRESGRNLLKYTLKTRIKCLYNIYVFIYGNIKILVNPGTIPGQIIRITSLVRSVLSASWCINESH